MDPPKPFLSVSPNCVHGVKEGKGEERSSFYSEEDVSSTSGLTLLTIHLKGDLSSPALATGIVELGSKHLKSRAFFDLGSQRSLVAQDIVDELGLEVKGRVMLALSGINKTTPYQLYDVVNLIVKMGTVKIIVPCIVLSKLPLQIKTPSLMRTAQAMKENGIPIVARRFMGLCLVGRSFRIELGTPTRRPTGEAPQGGSS